MDVNLVGMAVLEGEQHTPRTVDVDRPKASQVSLQLVQPGRTQLPQVVQAGGRVQLGKPLLGKADIKPGELAFS
jgi:hypothetical protein